MSTLCLQLVDIKTILDEINIHKPESKKAPNLTLCFKNILEKMVGVTGIEPVTPSMSTKCSPAELHPHTISLWTANRCWHRINRRAICAAALATGYICTKRRGISSLFSMNHCCFYGKKPKARISMAAASSASIAAPKAAPITGQHAQHSDRLLTAATNLHIAALGAAR